jgi:aminopeptidase N
MDLFQKATRKKFRFPSPKGQLTTEQLWDLPLTSKTGMDLDSIAKTVNAELKLQSETSFVTPNSNPAKTVLTEMLDVLIAIIAVQQAENEARRKAASKQAEKQTLLEALQNAETQALMKLTPEEIKARIAALEAE